MLYNSETGKRIKEPYNHVTWVHSVLHKGDYNLKQCFFGEHLLPEDKSRPVALVESEKTALIASYYLPQFLWIASGGKNGCFNANSLFRSGRRSVVLFPDLGATDYWQSKIGLMKSYGIEVRMFDYMETNATENERKRGVRHSRLSAQSEARRSYPATDDKEKSSLENTDRYIRSEAHQHTKDTPLPKVSQPKKRGFRL